MTRRSRAYAVGLRHAFVVSNTHETIAEVHRFFACFFPVCLVSTPQIPSGSHKKGQANGRVSNRDL